MIGPMGLARRVAVAVVVAVMGCGPSAGDGEGSSSGSSDGGSTRGGSGPTTSTTAAVDSTTAASDSTTAVTEAGSTDGSGDVCSPDPPTEVPAPPPGCEHYYLHDAAGQPDPTRPSGLWSCEETIDGVYRAAAVACACERFRLPCRTGDVDACRDRGACEPGESCVDYSGACDCLAQCNADAECPADHACLCASGIPIAGAQRLLEPYNHCLPADCWSDDDCGGPLRCRLSFNGCGRPESFHCTGPADECVDGSDCPGGNCRWNEAEARWTCDRFIPCD
jgi:hypothetical protein